MIHTYTKVKAQCVQPCSYISTSTNRITLQCTCSLAWKIGFSPKMSALKVRIGLFTHLKGTMCVEDPWLWQVLIAHWSVWSLFIYLRQIKVLGFCQEFFIAFILHSYFHFFTIFTYFCHKKRYAASLKVTVE